MRSHISYPTTTEPTMQILVRIKDVYGNRTIYPVCPAAELFAQIAGTKTLPLWVIDKVKKLGYEIVVEQEPVTL